MTADTETIKGRYYLSGIIGRGRITTIHRAHGSFLDKPVALKILQTREQAELETFKNEFKLLCQLSHPKIVQAFDFGLTINGFPFFTCELIEGADIKSYAQKVKLRDIIPVVLQLLETLDFLHLMKITHGDLKPTNILVEEQKSGNPSLRLIDLGLATIGKQQDFSNWKGTQGYIAPEILRGEEFDHRADLYSLGVILYEIVTGKLPFTGPDYISQAKSQLEDDKHLASDIPESVAEPLRNHIVRLLSRNPEERPQSALELLEEVEKMDGGKSVPHATYSICSLLASYPLVGKDAPSSSFQEHYSAVESEQKGKFILITGELGLGKSRFLKECEIFCELEAAPLVRCRTFSSLETVDELYHSILKQLSLICKDVKPDLLQRHENLQTQDSDKLTLNKILSDSIAEVAQILEKPLVITFDDLDSWELEQLEFLSYLSPHLEQNKIIIVACLSIGQSQSAQDKKSKQMEEKLKAMLGSTLQKVGLQPLSLLDYMVFLKEALNAPKCEAVLELIYSKSGGNFLLINQIFDFLSKNRGIRRTSGGFEIDKTILENFTLTDQLADEIEERLSRLTFESLNILSTAAVLGPEFESGLLDGMCQDDAVDIYTGLNEIISEGLLKFEKSDKSEHLCFPNGLVRDYIYKKIEPAKKEELHRKAGDVIQEISKDKNEGVVKQLAYHYYLGKDLELAFKYSILAAEKAEKECSYESAIHFYLHALEYYQESFGKFLKLKEEILERIGILYDLIGEPAKGLDYLKRAASVLQERKGSVKLLSQILGTIGNIHVRLGEFEEAISYYEEGLRALSQTNYLVERTALLNDLGLAYQRKQELQKALNYLHESIELLEKENLAVVQLADAYRLKGVVCWMEGEYESSLSSYSKSAEIYKKVKDPKGEGMVLNNLGILYFDKGEPEKALEQLNKVLAIPEIHNDTALLSSLYNNLSVSYIELCDWEKAEKMCRKNLVLREKIDSEEGIGLALNNLGFINSQKGLLGSASTYHQKAKRIFEKLNQKLGIAKSIFLQAIVHYQRGEFSKGVKLLDEAITIYRDFSAKLGLADGLCLLAKINLENNEMVDAERFFREALKLYEEQKHNFGIMESLLGMTQVALSRDNFNEAEAFLAQVEKLLSENRNPYLVALCKQTKGVLLQQRGFFTEALEQLTEAAKIFRKIHSKYELANTYILIGKVKQMQKLTKASRQYLNQALFLFKELQNQKMMEVIEQLIQSTGDISAIESDRLNTFYRFSALVNEVFDTDELLKNSLDLAISLLGAERGAFILLNPLSNDLELKASKQIESETREDALNISKQVITEVTQKEEPLIIEDAQTDSRVNLNISVVMYNILSILCVPLKIRGQVVGTIYLDHRSIPNVFSKDDLEFMKAFGNLISAALEKSQLYQKMSEELFQVRNEAIVKYYYPEVIGQGEKMQEIFALIEKIANSRTSVLLIGESGTGKELVANLIFRNSSRVDKPFVKVNCAALPESILESELFGIEEKVATGVNSRKGKFEQAHTGTIFLDEVGDMSLSTQAKVLRVLQEREFERVGGSQTIQADVRIIAATNMDLEEKIQNNTFRKDLYYRLNPITIKLPPLRERKEDIPLLVEYFLEKFVKENRKPKLKMTSEVMSAFLDYPWPGNVRELSNVIEKGVLLSEDTVFSRKALPLYLRTGREFSRLFGQGKLEEILLSVEKQIILSALESRGWNQSKAARRLGIPESSLRRKMEKLRIERPVKL